MTHLLCKKLSPVLLVMTLLLATGITAQTQTKRYSEKFNVNDEVKVEVNTAYTDLVFETWNRDQIEVEAIIEIEGVSEEEAEKLFREWNFKAIGSSDKVTVTTGKMIHGKGFDQSMVFFNEGDGDYNFEILMPDVDQVMQTIPKDFVMPPMPPAPPMPLNFGKLQFDYDAYKKDGDAYLKEWKKQFQENFDEKYIKEYEAWGKEVEELYKNRKDEIKVRKSELMKNKEEREKVREEVRKEMEENRAEIRIMAEKAREKARKARNEVRENAYEYRIQVAPGSDKVFFYKGEGESRNLKVKKTIKIKAPKGAKLDLDVRHGEIKLAENYKNINATLFYTRLHAPLVDGEDTRITASYSPMRVDYWKEGSLNVNYAKVLELERVGDISLEAKSSNVVVGELSGNAIINGSFGDLVINNFSDSFKSLDVVIENSDVTLVLPALAFDIYARTTYSRMNTPAGLDLKVNQLQSSKQIKGFSKSGGSGRNIHIIANYSNVNLQGI